MPRISLKFSERNFEYDVQTLLQAFFPGSEIKIWADGEQEPEGAFDDRYEVIYLNHAVRFFCNGQMEEAQVASFEDRPEAKNVIKKLVYDSLCKKVGHTLPWGDLTGIRPVKLAMHALETGLDEADTAEHMRRTYFVSDEKAELAARTAVREKRLLDSLHTDKDGYSLYVGIPFCPSICLYCSFGSHPFDKWGYLAEAYLEALEKELAFIASEMSDFHLDTIYIGGGTPTTLTPEQMRRLCETIMRLFPMEEVREWTVEAGRPDTITREKLEVLREFPITRISVNPQTMRQETLDLIGRRHTVTQIYDSYALARELGFDNINMDIIVGLPDEGKEEVRATLEALKKMAPDSLTVHSLALKRAARLSLFKDQYEPISFENSTDIMNMTMQYAEEMQLNPYYLYRQKNMAGNFENVGYAAEGKEGLYNILIMEEKQTIMAAGAGASTKFVFDGGERIERAENVKSVEIYIERIDEMIERKRKLLS